MLDKLVHKFLIKLDLYFIGLYNASKNVTFRGFQILLLVLSKLKKINQLLFPLKSDPIFILRLRQNRS